MKWAGIFRKKKKEVGVAAEDQNKRSDEQIDDGIPEVEVDGDQSVILDDDVKAGEEKKLENQKIDGEEENKEPDTAEDGIDENEKEAYEFTSEQLGDIAGDKTINATTQDVAAFIQRMETDPLSKKKTFHKVQWFGEDYGTFPISHQDMVDALEPGKYYVRVVDAKEVRNYFGGFRVDIGVEDELPTQNKTWLNPPNRSATVDSNLLPSSSFPPGSQTAEAAGLDARLKNVETLVVETTKMIQTLAGNMVQKNDPQQMMNTMTMALMQKTLEGGNGSDKVIEKIADMMTKTQEMMMGFRTKVEEKKIDFDFEKIRSQNEMELKKMELTLAKGMPADDEGKKSKNTLQSFIEGLQSFMQTAGPALKEIRKLRELEMGVVPTGDDTGEQETTPE